MCKTCFLLMMSLMLCGCSSRLYKCAFKDDKGEWTEYFNGIGSGGERVKMSAYYATETSGSTVGDKGFNCLRVSIFPPADQTVKLNPGRSFMKLGSTQMSLVQNDLLIGQRLGIPDDSPNVLNTALYRNSGANFPEGEGMIKLSYRIGEIDREFSIPYKLKRKTEFYVPSLPTTGR